jgi:peptidoglycan/LPS O-acetylase OafA/YrhL
MTASGPFWMSIFFLLSGYVCAIKPIRLSRAGQAEEARRVIASSAFRRLLRIGLPATLGTFFAWTLAQIGAFNLVPEVELDESWLSRTTPKRIPGVWSPIKELITQCVSSTSDVSNCSSIRGHWRITLTKQISGV